MEGLSPALPLPLATGHEATVEGKVRRIVFDANSGDMRVFEVETDDCTVETVRQYSRGGEMAPLKKGDQIRVLGKVIHHKRFGRQFEAKDVLRQTPTSAQGVAKVISGKEFKGIGPKAAQKLVDELGSDLISILNRGDPGELISDILGNKKARALVKAWLENQASNMTDAMLAELGIGPETRKKIKKEIPDIETVIQTDPYRIAKEIDGVGFLTADQLAMRAGVFRPDSPQRLAVGLVHALDLGGQEGHTGLSKAQLIDKACDALTFGDRRAISAILEQEIAKGDLVMSPNALVQDRWMSMREAKLARNIVRLARAKIEDELDPMAVMRHLSKAQAKHKLTDEQFQAVAAGVTESLSIVTGGPGTGKTTTIRAIIDTLQLAAKDSGVQMRIMCIAPTGKAADRMNESTGHPSSTFHSALGKADEGFGFNHTEKNPFDIDVIIADEWSMVDTRLGEALFQAIKAGKTRLIMAGDVNQLASVDPGRVLHDIIESNICVVTRFTKVHRTGEGSAIAIGAAKINEGKMPDFGPPGKSDLVFIEIDEPAVAADRIVKMVSETLPAFTKLSTDRIQVLSPGKNSAVGVHALNTELQKALNPSQPLAMNDNGTALITLANGQKARMGDRVICMKNSRTADKDEEAVFNGDVGVIDDLEVDDGPDPSAYLGLDCGKKRLMLERSYWNSIALAYALTIHKSQGSEYDVVVIPMTKSHYMMLKRNLLYTGVTRAKKLCVIIGSKQALRQALTTMDGTSRQTGLLSRIKAFAKLN